MKLFRTVFATLLLFCASISLAQTPEGVDPSALLRQIRGMLTLQESKVADLTVDAESIMREKNGDELRVQKRITMKFFPDTTWYTESYLSASRNGESITGEELKKTIEAQKKDADRRRGRNASFPILRPFRDSVGASYEFQYEGIVPESESGRLCHLFRVNPKRDDDTLVQGSYYFDSESFLPIRADFTPAKLPKGMMFRLAFLSMTMLYTQSSDGVYLPDRFEITGRGKAALFIGVRIEGTEVYRNPEINTGIPDSLFRSE